MRISQSVQLAKQWGEIGCGTPDSAQGWVNLGQSPESLQQWFRLGVDSCEELAGLLSEGWTPEHLNGLDVKTAPPEGWSQWIQLTTQGQRAHPEIVNSWLVAHASIGEAAEWVAVGATPFERDLLMANGVSSEMLQRLKTSRCAELARNLKSRHLDLEKWIENDFTFDEMMLWKQLHVSIEQVLDWRALQVPTEQAQRFVLLGFTPVDYLENFDKLIFDEANLFRWENTSLPSRSVKTFVLGGIPDPETARKWLNGFGNDPTRAVIRYRAYGGDYRRARMAQYQSEKLQMRAATFQAVSPMPMPTHPRSERTSTALPFSSEEWLEEIVAWARTLQARLRKSIQSPSVVVLDELDIEIQIELDRDLISGQVKIGKQILKCAFDPESFDSVSDSETSEQRFVLGVCLCWFIDCSIVIHRQSEGTSAPYRVVNIGSGRSSSSFRYVPTPIFKTRKDDRSVSDSAGLKVRHQVSGHIRTLPSGRRGSVEARKSAPRHIQRIMKNNETYVQPHFRGTEEQKRELETRLSRYSALGEAMSDLAWF